MEKYTAIKERADKYRLQLQQVKDFRKIWKEQLKVFIQEKASEILEQTGISGKILVEERFENLESVSISLGKGISGISEQLGEDTKRNIIKERGSLIYSQLFNGKIQVWLTYPLLEGLMEMREPKMIGIYKPNKFDEEVMLSSFDAFFKELIQWENYDDDKTKHAMTRIGFGGGFDEQEEE